jgi:large subunit ribosomal protein L30
MPVTITQVKSQNGANGKQRDTMRSLGLKKIGQSVQREDSPQLRGQLYAVAHLVQIEEDNG